MGFEHGLGQEVPQISQTVTTISDDDGAIPLQVQQLSAADVNYDHFDRLRRATRESNIEHSTAVLQADMLRNVWRFLSNILTSPFSKLFSPYGHPLVKTVTRSKLGARI